MTARSIEQKFKDIDEYESLPVESEESFSDGLITCVASKCFVFCDKTIGKADRLIQKRLKGVLA